MDDIDNLLSIIENRTRRRILEMITESPSYPLQLSKELGVSQQAVMKNLALMEQNGLVSSYRESSSMGPERIVYVPNTEFTLVVNMHNNTFSAKVIGYAENCTDPTPTEESLERSRRRIEGIDRRLTRLRSRIRQEFIDSFMQSLPESMDEDMRRAILNRLCGKTEEGGSFQ